MKKQTLILLLLYIISTVYLIGQESIPVDLKLENGHSSNIYNYSASNSIRFLPGFNFKAIDNNYLKAWINPFNLSPSPYPDNIFGGSNNRIVGKINDEFTVTPSGQAAYEIPITVPSGTGGMTPQLSIVYNSSSKEGLLGYGFDLSGLSMINRAPQNLHVDGKITDVDFSDEDRFMLDGSRLIRISPIAQIQNIEYRTENNTFYRITTTGTQESPTAFTVYTKSGLIYEYGSNNSTLKTTTSTNKEKPDLFWLLKKVSDTKGNYYTISYERDDQNGNYSEYWPMRIDYTGNDNAGLSPYCSIRFSYKDISPSDIYISGTKVRKSKVIETIGVYYSEKKVKSYDLRYKPNLDTYLLETVTEVAADGKKLNPTKFDWNIVNDFKPQGHLWVRNTSFLNSTSYLGDFNGDGKTDFLLVPEDSKEGIKLYLSNGSSYEYFGTFLEGRDMASLSVGDFNGDGISDVIIRYLDKSVWYYDLCLTNLSTSGNISISFNKELRDLRTSYKEDIYVGDFNGDGASDILIHDTSRETYDYSVKLSQSVSGKIDPLSTQKISTENPHRIKRIEIADFNGDGLSDAFLIHEVGYDLLQNLGGKLGLTKQGTYPSINNQIYFGDFNGDGKTDILVTAWNYDPHREGWPEWQILFSTGKDFERIFISKQFNPKDKIIYVADINGDGMDDFFAYPKVSITSNVPIRYFINEKHGASFRSYEGHSDGGVDTRDIHIADINGDGKADILVQTLRLVVPGYYTNIMTKYPNNLLSSITDGFGNKTEISYKPLTDKSIYENSNVRKYPLSTITPSWYVVDKVSQPNGIGGKFEKTYKYKNLYLHKQGRGILGFEYFIEKDEINNIETISQFEIHPTEYVTALKKTETRVAGKLLSQNTNINKLRYYQNKVFTYEVVGSTEKKYEINTNKEYSSISTRTVYDDYGNVTRSVIKYNNNDSIVSENQYKEDLNKWYLGRLVQATVTKINPKGIVKRISKFSYDSASGLLNKEEFEPGNLELGYVKTYIHDKFGNIEKSTITPNDTKNKPRTKQSKYDSQGRFEEESIDYFGYVTKRDINKDLGLVKSETDPNGMKTEYIYDSFGKIEFTKTPLGNTQSLVLWSKGHPDAPINSVYFTYNEVPGSPATLEFFDGLGRSLRTKVIGFDGKSIYADAVYNEKGQVKKTSEPYFSGNIVYWNESEYDLVGRVTKQSYPDNTYHLYAYDGLKTVTTSPLGLKDTKTIDIQGRIIESVDNLGGKVTYAYDAAGNCETVIGPRTTIKTSFDITGNRTKLVDSDLGTTEYKYNAYGELIWQKDGNNNIKTVEYDAGGRVKKSIGTEGTTEYIYDTLRKGMLTSVSSPKYLQSYKYDNLGRVISITEIIDTKTYVTQTSFDIFNRVDKVTYPSGFAVKHIYNTYGYLAEVRNNQSNQLYWTAQKVNARGQLEQFKLGNNLTTTTTYHPQKGYVTSIKTPGIQDWSYAFNADGNLESRKDSSRNLTERFEYDKLNRLWKTSHNGVLKEEVLYDAAGNITSKTGIGTKFEYYDKTNRLKSVSGGSYTPPDWDITYTSFNKISQVVQSKNNVILNSLILVYGSDEQRKKAIYTKDGKTDTRYYVGALYEENELATGEVKKLHHIFANGGAIAIFEQSNQKGETLLYLHKDHLNSVQAYSNKDGKLAQELSYDAWGRRRSADEWKYYSNISDAKALHDRGFTGHEHLDMFEMINMNGRMYDPMLGRFLSPDPFVQAPDFTQGLNRYIYCLNNPLSLVDPSGYSWFSKNWKSLVATAVGIAVSFAIPGGQVFGVVILKGALGGLASGIVGATLNGANIGQIAKSGIMGGLWGGASASAAFGVGEWAKGAANPLLKKLIGHSLSQGTITAAQGGNFKHGFISGLVSAAGGYGMTKMGTTNKLVLVSANAIVGGTAAELGGGKFANGAITASYVVLFNDLFHSDKDGKVKFKSNSGKSHSSLVGAVVDDLYNALEEIKNSLSQIAPVAVQGTGSLEINSGKYTGVGIARMEVLQGTSANEGFNLGLETTGAGGLGLTINASATYYFYTGDVQTFNANYLFGESMTLGASLPLWKATSFGIGVSWAPDNKGQYIIGITHSFGVGKGAKYGISYGISDTAKR